MGQQSSQMYSQAQTPGAAYGDIRTKHNVQKSTKSDRVGVLSSKTNDMPSDASLKSNDNSRKRKRHSQGSEVLTMPIVPKQSDATNSLSRTSSKSKNAVLDSQKSQVATENHLIETTPKATKSKSKTASGLHPADLEPKKSKKKTLNEASPDQAQMAKVASEPVPAANGLCKEDEPCKKRKKQAQATSIPIDDQVPDIIDATTKHSKTPTSNKNKRQKTAPVPVDDDSDHVDEPTPKTSSKKSEKLAKIEESSEDTTERQFAWNNATRISQRGRKVPKRVHQEGRFSMHRAMNQTKVTGLRKRGELTEEEVVILENLINDFMMLNDLSTEQIQILIAPGATGKQVKAFWLMVDEALPLRAPRHDHLVKQVRSRAYDGLRGTLDDFEVSELKEMIENEPSLPWREFGEALNRRADILRDYYHAHLKHLHHPGAKRSKQVESGFGSWTDEEDTRLKDSVVDQIRALKREELGINPLDIETIEVTETDMINPKYYMNPTTLAIAVGTRGSYPTREHWKRIQWELTRVHQRAAAKVKYGDLHDTELQATSNYSIMLPADRYACLKGMLAYIREEAPQKIMRYQPSRAKKLEKYLPNDWSQADCNEVLHRTEIDHPRGEYASRDTYLVKILASYEKIYTPLELSTFYSGPPEICLNKYVQVRKYRWEYDSGEKSMGLTQEAAEKYVEEFGMVERARGWSQELLSGLVDVRPRSKMADGYRTGTVREKPKSSYFVTVSDDESSDEEGVVPAQNGDGGESTTETEESSSEESSDDEEESD